MINRLIILYFFILSIHVLYVQSQNDSVKESTTAKTTTTKTRKPKYIKALKDYDWSLWCKLQPNTYICGKGHLSSRYYYDKKLEGCKSFYYGQCKPSFNNFNTISQCNENCRDAGIHPLKGNFSDNIICRLQPDFGDCFEYHPMYYYDRNSKRCRGFSYSGCGGNKNRFANAQLCSAVCLNLIESDVI